MHLITNDGGELEVDSVLHGDSLELLRALPDSCVDLVFADPPYNLQLEKELLRPNQSVVAGVDDAWDQFSSFEDYDLFTTAWLAECRRVLKESATLWVIGSYHNIFRVGTILQNLGYWIMNDVVWIKTNPMPNFRGSRFCNAHETLIWAKRSKDQRRYTFNYRALKSGNDDLQMRSDWYFPVCGGPERLSGADGKIHSTQKPEAILSRILRACTNPGDVVLDPFFGSGTTGAVAKQLGRHYIGIEKEGRYVTAARERIAGITSAPPELLDAPGPGTERRIPFVSLIEMGLIEPGARMRLGNKDVFATVKVDGTLAADGAIGSIHKVGAALQGLPACNGWDAWYYEAAGSRGFRPLDELRRQARKLMSDLAEGEDTGAVSSAVTAEAIV